MIDHMETTTSQAEILSALNKPAHVHATLPTDEPPKDRRLSCHRCGNIRKRIICCKECPHIFCMNCSEKMKEEYGENVFVGGCPVCKDLCCCRLRTLDCKRKHHCYKKCPVSKASPTKITAHHNERNFRNTTSMPFFAQSDSDSEIEVQRVGNFQSFSSPTNSVLDIAKVLSNPDDISMTSFAKDIELNTSTRSIKTPTASIKKKAHVSNPTPKKHSKRKSNVAAGTKPIVQEIQYGTAAASLDQNEKRMMRQRMDEVLSPLNTQSIDTPYFYPTPWGYYPIMLQPIQNITAREDLIATMNGNVGNNQPLTNTPGGFIPLSNLPPPGVLPPQFSTYLLNATQAACYTPTQPMHGTPSIPSRGGSTRTSFDSSSSMSSAMHFPPNIIPIPMTPPAAQTPTRCTCAECYNYYPVQGQPSVYCGEEGRDVIPASPGSVLWNQQQTSTATAYRGFTPTTAAEAASYGMCFPGIPNEHMHTQNRIHQPNITSNLSRTPLTSSDSFTSSTSQDPIQPRIDYLETDYHHIAAAAIMTSGDDIPTVLPPQQPMMSTNERLLTKPTQLSWNHQDTTHLPLPSAELSAPPDFSRFATNFFDCISEFADESAMSRSVSFQKLEEFAAGLESCLSSHDQEESVVPNEAAMLIDDPDEDYFHQEIVSLSPPTAISSALTITNNNLLDATEADSNDPQGDTFMVEGSHVEEKADDNRE